ncbi:MAG TPA: hypothetical protein VLJ79_12170 [Candidatus Binatia bacterium]|nr:hypothetical protein [Candidatus Binatia bacterium]
MKSQKRFKARVPYDNCRSKLWVKGINQSSSPWEEKALSVFQPDILVTVQYLATYRRRFHLQPEQLLMLAVLEDAVVCFQDNLTAVTPRKRALFREAEEWILDDDNSYLFSFDNICEGVALDPNYVRRGLIRWKEMALRELDRKPARQQWAS